MQVGKREEDQVERKPVGEIEILWGRNWRTQEVNIKCPQIWWLLNVREVIKYSFHFCRNLKSVFKKVQLAWRMCFSGDSRRGRSGGRAAATAVTTASVYSPSTAHSVLSMAGFTVWLSVTSVFMVLRWFMRSEKWGNFTLINWPWILAKAKELEKNVNKKESGSYKYR